MQKFFLPVVATAERCRELSSEFIYTNIVLLVLLITCLTVGVSAFYLKFLVADSFLFFILSLAAMKAVDIVLDLF